MIIDGIFSFIMINTNGFSWDVYMWNICQKFCIVFFFKQNRKYHISRVFLLCQLWLWIVKNSPIITVMKTETIVFPEKWYFKNSSFWHSNSRFVCRQQKHHCLCFHYWDYLTNFWRNYWKSIIDVVERLGYFQ